MHRPTAILLLAALLPRPVAAAQNIAGTYVDIYYNSSGIWNYSSAARGLKIYATSKWHDVTYPGTPWQQLTVEYSVGSTAYSYSANTSSSSFTLVTESNLSSGTWNIAYYKLTAGVITLEKWESWQDSEKFVRVNWKITNTGSSAVSNFRIMHGIDPDQDVTYWSNYNTYIDSIDVDGDGTKEYVQAVGTSSGHTVAYGLCDKSYEDIGGTAWSTDADATFYDWAGTSYDNTIHWRRQHGSVAAGATANFGFIFLTDTTASAAQTAWKTYKSSCGVVYDADGDGYGSTTYGGTDCDDTDATVYPGATETCDGEDDDCDGTIDEGDASDALTWYADGDGDGFGDPDDAVDACTMPTGYVADDSDCDDADADVFPGADEYCNGIDDDCDGTTDEGDALDASTWYHDADGDTWGDPTDPLDACSRPTGYVADNTDCDDTNAREHPGATEIPASGIDYDCDGLYTCYEDADDDGYRPDSSSTVASVDRDCTDSGEATATDRTGDCDDANAAVYPRATETCNGIDDDCDGDVDESSASDATTWYIDYDHDGYGSAAYSTRACTAPAGYVADSTDCDDYRAATYPGATEYCNGEDDDCDGTTDEGSAVDASTWYRDADADGWGDAASPTTACSEPTGYVADATDCDDAVASTHPTAPEQCNGVDDDCDGAVDEGDASDVKTWYRDADGDNYGDASVTATSCYQPDGYVADATDCDDTDASTSPGADETCDGEDDDCDGAIDEDSAVDATTWYRDADGDGFGDPATTDVECTVPTGYVADRTDCDDASATTFPGADETCDGEDDDCDGIVDEDSAVDAPTWYRDADGDGYGDLSLPNVECTAPSGHVADATDCDDTQALVNPGARELCNGIDDDCDGSADEDSATDAVTWYRDADGDGFGDAAATQDACYQPSGYVADATDCDDTSASTWPGAAETCDGEDDDCDGTIDEDSAVDAATWFRDADADGYGDAASTTVACWEPSGYVADATDCDDTTATTNPGATEWCNGVDDDCDGETDETSAADAPTWYQDADADGFGNAAVTTVACTQPSGWVADASDCDDANPGIRPDGVEYCNGVDDDCDGTIDEADSGDALVWYEDADGDGRGNPAVTMESCAATTGWVSDASDCDDANGSVFPGAPEYCNGVDDDCDGTVDEGDANDAATWYADADGDGYGDPTVTTTACTTPEGYVSDASDCDDAAASTHPTAEETWYDGVDADCLGDSDYDADQDTHDATEWGGDDCDDTNPEINPAAGEVFYDGVDQDCDGLSDFDFDADGYDSEAWGGDDCNDSDATVYPGAPDVPYDGITNDCDLVSDYDRDQDGHDATEWGGDDCDDANSDIHPDMTETWYDGIDSDCAGDDDYDQDGDGYSSAAWSGDDCDDANPEVNPGAAEIWYDGIDQDCSGTDDNDADSDGYVSADAGGDDCNDADSAVNPGAFEAWYDGIDQDCLGDDDFDQDGDGQQAADFGGTDCDDTDETIALGAPEVWYDGIDQDCAGGDDFDQDGDGWSLETDCDDTDAASFPGAPGLDEDCNPVDTGETGLVDTGETGETAETGDTDTDETAETGDTDTDETAETGDTDTDDTDESGTPDSDEPWDSGTSSLKGGGGCACAAAPTDTRRSGAALTGLLLALGVLLRRRR